MCKLHLHQQLTQYWSHVVNCASCSAAYKGFNVLEVFLRVVSVASIAIAAAAKQGAISAAARTAMVLMAVLFYASSRWLAHFIYRNFHYHDYDHACFSLMLV
ncbi:protochlorophyllide-dependent translocon component 52 [Quercus suber]|uniref:Protochlorophyllide-dependent translocon component 52 n=1 Tax=Quercus suber TaxID=58331 RepID=A0AAW0KR93_QUESU